MSILHAQSTPPSGGETGFADIRAARATLSRPLLERAKDAYIQVSVRDIADFAKGTEEDLSAFPDAEHPILDHHAVDGGPTLYVGSPHMKVGGLESDQAGKVLINMLLLHATSPAFTYFHAWDKGDIIIWDNTQTLHSAMPCKYSARPKSTTVRNAPHPTILNIDFIFFIFGQIKTMARPFVNSTEPRLVCDWRMKARRQLRSSENTARSTELDIHMHCFEIVESKQQ